MNIRPAPPVPGNTESECMDSAVRTIFTVSKEEMQRTEAEWQQANGKHGKARRIALPISPR
jgi:hypothetical protein